MNTLRRNRRRQAAALGAAFSLLVLTSSAALPAESALACGPKSKATAQTYAVSGEGHELKLKPDASSGSVVNEKATAILKRTHYASIDYSVKVLEECTQGAWSRVRVTEPEHLRDTYIGWVDSRVLRGEKKDAAGLTIFTAADFNFDAKTRPHAEIIVRGVNKVHRENARCKKIDPATAYLSTSKGTASDPVFFVTCGEGAGMFNAFFSRSDVQSDQKLGAVGHVAQSVAVNRCEALAKERAAHPSTVKFSRVMDLAVRETPNGNTEVKSTFTAKNAFNLQLKYDIRCLTNASGLLEGTVTESRQ